MCFLCSQETLYKLKQIATNRRAAFYPVAAIVIEN